MRFQPQKIFRSLDLREYAPEIETSIVVMVNPPKSELSRLYELRLQQSRIIQRSQAAVRSLQRARTEWIIEHKSMPTDDDLADAIAANRDELEQIANATNLIGAELVAWMRANWSQGPDESTHWSEEDITRLVDYCVDQDPGLWEWLINRTQAMIEDYRRGQKKA